MESISISDCSSASVVQLNFVCVDILCKSLESGRVVRLTFLLTNLNIFIYFTADKTNLKTKKPVKISGKKTMEISTLHTGLTTESSPHQICVRRDLKTDMLSDQVVLNLQRFMLLKYSFIKLKSLITIVLLCLLQKLFVQ